MLGRHNSGKVSLDCNRGETEPETLPHGLCAGRSDLDNRRWGIGFLSLQTFSFISKNKQECFPL